MAVVQPSFDYLILKEATRSRPSDEIIFYRFVKPEGGGVRRSFRNTKQPTYMIKIDCFDNKNGTHF